MYNMYYKSVVSVQSTICTIKVLYQFSQLYVLLKCCISSVNYMYYYSAVQSSD